MNRTVPCPATIPRYSLPTRLPRTLDRWFTSSQDRLESPIEIRVEEVIPAPFGHSRQNPLTSQKDLGEFTQADPQPRRRNREESRPEKRPTQRAGEITISSWFRRRGIHRSRNPALGCRVQQQSDHIIDMDPGHPLSTITQASPKPEPER